MTTDGREPQQRHRGVGVRSAHAPIASTTTAQNASQVYCFRSLRTSDSGASITTSAATVAAKRAVRPVASTRAPRVSTYAATTVSTENPSTTSRPRCKPEPGTSFKQHDEPERRARAEPRQAGERRLRERRDPRFVEPERMPQHDVNRVHEDRRDRDGAVAIAVSIAVPSARRTSPRSAPRRSHAPRRRRVATASCTPR